MVQIIPSNSLECPIKLMESHIKANGSDPYSTCPWVKAGGLYMSVTQTATQSWWPLVTALQTGAQCITVVSGRHGTQAGQAVSTHSGTWNSKFVMDDSFYTTDVESAKKYPKVQVKNAADIKTTQQLKSLTQMWLALGPVIYAWCHSLFSMMDHDEAMYDSKKMDKKTGNTKWIIVESYALHLSSKSVKSLVDEWYGWA